MGWQDRPYKDEGSGPTMRGLGGKSVVTYLLVINCVIFVLDAILSQGSRVPAWLSPTLVGYFSVDKAILSGQVWRFVTYQFLHADFWHVLMNMIGLYFFGPMMEQWWGSKRFLGFYLLCGIAGAVPMGLLVLAGVFPAEVGLVGASGALYGVLIGAATLYPNQTVRLLFPPIPMKLKTMAFVFMGISLLSVIAGTNDGGNAAHLAGAALGFFLVKRPGLLNWADRLSPQAIQDGYTKGRYEKKIKKEEATREEVDRILAKVSEKGLQSLTTREKKILQEDTDRLRDR